MYGGAAPPFVLAGNVLKQGDGGGLPIGVMLFPSFEAPKGSRGNCPIPQRFRLHVGVDANLRKQVA